jgi:hypothetical protein
VIRHEFLGVPICKVCSRNYNRGGEWAKDEDGYFEHCRWCGEGGDIVCCENQKCKNAFCTKCIKRNLGRTAVTKIQDEDDWRCFICQPKQIREARCLFYSIYQVRMTGIRGFTVEIRDREMTFKALRKVLFAKLRDCILSFFRRLSVID